MVWNRATTILPFSWKYSKGTFVVQQKELQAKMDTYNVVKWFTIVGQIVMIVEAIQDNEGKLSEANRGVAQIEDKIWDLKNSISDCENTIQCQNKRVSEIRSNIYAISSQCSKLSSNHSNVCDAIANLQEAKHTLEKFADITECGNGSSQFLEELIDSASKLGHRKSAKDLKSAEYHALTSYYLEKLNELQELVIMKSVHLHFFRCTKCNSNNKGLPWLYHGNLICEQCWTSTVNNVMHYSHNIVAINLVYTYYKRFALNYVAIQSPSSNEWLYKLVWYRQAIMCNSPYSQRVPFPINLVSWVCVCTG